MKQKEIKGKCQVCGRVRYKGKPVLEYTYFKTANFHTLYCLVCDSSWASDTKERVMEQVAS
jgi:uncharacterized protein YlaI